MPGQDGRYFFGNRLQFIIGISRCKVIENPADAGQQVAAAVERYDRILKVGCSRIGHNSGNFFIMNTDTFMESRQEVFILDPVECRSFERGAIRGKEGVFCCFHLFFTCGA